MRAVDTLHLGRRRWICCFQVGEVLVDPGPSLAVGRLLEELSDLSGWQPRALLLTHIHFDHAGAAGTLARMFPDLVVYVHERGAPHMSDPQRLWASASRLYGEQHMLALWGEFLPVPSERLRVLRGGETLRFGEDTFEVAYTPGHAKHHVSYLHGDTAFVGDVGGVRIAPGAPVLPPTPPPDIDLEAWRRSLKLVRGWHPQRLAITHFGAHDQPEQQLDELERRLERWASAAREHDRDAWVREVGDDLRAAVGEETYDSFMAAVPLEQSYAGLRRYWETRGDLAA